MFCPYIRSSCSRIAVISYNQEGNENGSILTEHYANMDCKKEECGAWYMGKCNYKMEE